MPFQTGQTILLGFKNLSDSIRVAQAVSTLQVLSADSSDTLPADIFISYQEKKNLLDLF
jgi:hypothetical protein